MTKEEVILLKEQYQKKSIYYGNLGFTILQSEFQEMVKILTEIENMMPTESAAQEEDKNEI